MKHINEDNTKQLEIAMLLPEESF